jgi:hypothetical protein
MKSTLLISFAIFLFACGQTEQPQASKETINQEVQNSGPIETIEQAHAKNLFLSKDFVQFDILLEFGGTERLNGTITLATNSTKGKISYKSGKEIYFDQNKVFADSSEGSTNSIRFAAFTWSYFFLFPYKLSDPGTNWSDMKMDSLNGKKYEVQKLTFSENIGDAPDDWYIVYSDPDNHLIEAAAYIVTAGGTSVKEAEEDPHAITYDNYQKVEGVPLSHSWKFWQWRSDSGLKRQLGKAELSNFKFVTEEEVNFSPPSHFTEIK